MLLVSSSFRPLFEIAAEHLTLYKKSMSLMPAIYYLLIGKA